MKRNPIYPQKSITMTIIMLLFFVSQATAQEDFQIKWSMDNTQAGVSSHINFSPYDATLAGGINSNALNGGYGFTNAIIAAYVVRPWPIPFSNARYMEFKFSANSFKYNISSLSFRLKRSPTGSKNFKVRSSVDNFISDLTSSTLPAINTFYSFSLPVGYNNLSDGTFSFRIYGYNTSDNSGTTWFDEIIINGQVLAIVLPIDLTYFKAEKSEENVMLSWETAWEKNSKEFIVERSADLKEFEAIGTLKAAGEATGRMQYEFIDDNPLTGANYYRLRMKDRDDSFSFSKTLDVITDAPESPILVVPNPASPEKITISGQNIDPNLLSLTNLSGNTISFRFEPIQGNSIDLYPENPLVSGLYFLTYQKNGRKEHVKILVP
ncbi:MAG: T9SS type A sorting domain-containing protein [Dyadobacter sp.]|uniref:T9SS type A sorting domain-containing protein n=1 Tax=Dyadobacter sp. TaxID=1914288 RepID=UPI00326442F9